MFKGLRRFVGRLFGRREPAKQPPPFEAPLPPPPPITGGYEPPPISEPPPLPPEAEYTDLITVYGEYEEYVGTQTAQQWFDDMLLSGAAFEAKYGGAYFVHSPWGRSEFIDMVLENMDIYWSKDDWQTWRENYAAING